MKNPRLSAIKYPAGFNEKFSTSVSVEIVQRVLRAARLITHSARNFLFLFLFLFYFYFVVVVVVSGKNRKLSLSFAKSMTK